MRVFIAIGLPLAIRNKLAEIQDQLSLILPKIAWVAAPNLHLSLKFLGEITNAQLCNTQQIIQQRVKSSLAFEIKLETLGYFPNSQQPRIIWIGTHQPPVELSQLVNQIETDLYTLGLAKEKRTFQAHISLGRIKNHLGDRIWRENLKNINNTLSDAHLKFKVTGITLFQSQLGRQGATYSILKELNF